MLTTRAVYLAAIDGSLSTKEEHQGDMGWEDVMTHVRSIALLPDLASSGSGIAGDRGFIIAQGACCTVHAYLVANEDKQGEAVVRMALFDNSDPASGQVGGLITIDSFAQILKALDKSQDAMQVAAGLIVEPDDE